jgi:acyl-CoA dehydrogenase-like protein
MTEGTQPAPWESARLSADYVGYRDAATAILARHPGPDAVDAFGLSDVFEDGDFAPAYAFLEAQGRQAVVTPALGLLGMAHLSAAHGSAVAPGPCVLALPLGRDRLPAVAGFSESSAVVLDRPGVGFVRLHQPTATPPLANPADDYLRLVDGDGDVVVAESEAGTIHVSAEAGLRLGIAAEMLGVCTRLLDDAIQYAKARKQFGQPIGDFQAVQHLLAWGATEIHQFQCLFDIAVGASAAGVDPELARTLKALGGRVLHAVAQTAIQVTGAISFTWEYSLNRLHHRGLTLDQLAGPSADLVADIGRAARSDGAIPALFELGDVRVGA